MEPLACSNQPYSGLMLADEPSWQTVTTKTGYQPLYRSVSLGDNDNLNFWADEATTSGHSDLSPLIGSDWTEDILTKHKNLTGPLEFQFNRNGSIEKTGEGKSHAVMKHMKNSLKSLLLEHHPTHVQFTGIGESRRKVYDRIAKQLEQETPYVARKAVANYGSDTHDPEGDTEVYYLIHKDLINHPAYQENF